MKLLDLYCGAGGASMGYHRSGFEVVGVDIKPQPNYPFEFHQADALEYPLDGFNAIHASPPCQKYSTMSALWKDNEYPDLIEATRDRLKNSGVPWVIENVRGAPFDWYFVLCGTMFGLKLYRHRLFESSHLIPVPEHFKHTEVIGRRGEGVGPTGFSNPCGHPKIKGQRHAWEKSMDIFWMKVHELTQAIPPAYTEYIGTHLKQIIANHPVQPTSG